MISHIYTHVSHGHTDDIADPYKWYHTSIHTFHTATQTISQTHTNDITHLYTRFTRPHRRYRRPIQMISHICTNVVTQPYKQHTLHALQTSLCSQTNITYKHHRTIRTSWNYTNNIMQPSQSHTNITEPYKHHWAIQTSLSHTNNITQKCKHRAIQTSLSHTNNITQRWKRENHTNTTDFRSIYVSKCSASIQIPHIQAVLIHLNLILLRIQQTWWKGSLEKWWTELSVHSIPIPTCNK